MSDNVNHPQHYNVGKIEAIDVIEDWNLSFHLGNAVKYIARAGHKDKDKTIEDLYLNKENSKNKLSKIIINIS